jgi:hypothetical protein
MARLKYTSCQSDGRCLVETGLYIPSLAQWDDRHKVMDRNRPQRVRAISASTENEWIRLELDVSVA